MMRILLVEDNPADVRLTQKVLEKVAPPHELDVATDGQDALNFLYGEGEYVGRALPNLILLDLNLPRRTGREVLAEIKQDPTLRAIPVVVLSSSEDTQDIHAAYDLQASSFITKPPGLAEVRQAMTSLQSYWFSTVRLPAEG